jgi:hemerythrin
MMSESATADDTAEHQAIAAQIGLIREELQKPSPNAVLIFEYLEKLLEMTKAHFKHEEDHMVIDGYPGMLLHKRDHDYLVKGLRDFAASVVDETVGLSPSVGENLESWLRFHIKRFDDAYEAFANKRNQSV